MVPGKQMANEIPIRLCDECGSDEDVAECPVCEMQFCGEHTANLVTAHGCPYCAPIEVQEQEVIHAQAA